MLKLTPILCMNCRRPSAYTKVLSNRLFRITGTFRVAGVYKEKNRIVDKEYAHYPSCKHLRAREIKIRI